MDSRAIVNQIIESDLAYAAGLIDGEGAIEIQEEHSKNTNKTPKFYVKVRVHITSQWIVCWLRRTFSGYVCTNRKRPLTGRKISYAWGLQGTKAVNFLKAIFPYLKIKPAQAILAEYFQNTFIQHSGWKLKVPDKDIDRKRYLKSVMSGLNHGYDFNIEEVIRSDRLRKNHSNNLRIEAEKDKDSTTICS